MHYTLFFILFLVQTSNGQKELSFNDVKAFSSKFTIDSLGKFNGKGAEFLIDEIKSSHFVLLGETHDDLKIAEFTNSILPVLNDCGYEHFILEQGRWGLDCIVNNNSSVNNRGSIVSSIIQYYHQHEHYPLPFLRGKEDLEFMLKALEYEFNIIGIDQEYFYAFPMIFKLLFNLYSEPDEIKNTYAEAMDDLLSAYAKEKESTEYPLCQTLLNSDYINKYFNILSEDSLSKEIINDLKHSWEIYNLNSIAKSKSFKVRGQFMSDRFYQYYKVAQSKYKDPRFLIKLGAYHTMRGFTPLGIYDIGDVAHKIAKNKGQKDLNIYFMFRYYLDNEEPLGYFDNAEGSSKWLEERKPIMLQGDVEEWTLIDLKRLEEHMISSKLNASKFLLDLFNHHDIIIIPPATRDVTELTNSN